VNGGCARRGRGGDRGARWGRRRDRGSRLLYRSGEGGFRVPCPTDCSVPHNLTGFRADGLWDVVTEVQLRTKDEETRRRRIASVNESGEEIRSLFVDGERLGLEYHLDRTIEDGEDDIGDGNS
jgi:hypothetical protein